MKRLIAVSFVVAALMLAAFPRGGLAHVAPGGRERTQQLPQWPGEPRCDPRRRGRGRQPGRHALLGSVRQAGSGQERAARRRLDVPYRVDDQGGDVGGRDDDGRAGQDRSSTTTCRSICRRSSRCRCSRTYDEKAETYETRPEHQADHRPAAAHAHLGHRLQLVRPGLALVQRKTNHGSEDGAAARARARREAGPTAPARRCWATWWKSSRASASTRSPTGTSPSRSAWPTPSSRCPGQVRARGDHQQEGRGRQDHRDAEPAKLPVQLRADGGLFSTAPDYGRFLQMLLNGGQLGNARILKASRWPTC